MCLVYDSDPATAATQGNTGMNYTNYEREDFEITINVTIKVLETVTWSTTESQERMLDVNEMGMLRWMWSAVAHR